MSTHIEKLNRKNILLIADDIRMNSGIATMAREIVIGTANTYNWICVGAAINHPDVGKKLDLSADANKFLGINDSSIILYPNNGYGDIDLIRYLIKTEKPDAVMLFTDPRYFTWLFHMEDEIRNKIPIIYYTIWDSTPAPLWNKDFYDSCDSLLCISKQTKNLVELVLEDKTKNKVISYVPHGINNKIFFPIEKDSNIEYNQFKNKLFDNIDYDFVVFWNSRNIHRKHPGDVILSFQNFTSKLTPEQAKKCALVMHTQPIDDNGTNLYAVREAICDEKCNVIFSNSMLFPNQMNYLYNMADVTMLISSNEGWGLSLTESLMSGTMILANVQGGMQDQMRFENDEGKWIDFNKDFLSNHFGTYKKCGEWAYPIYPSSISLAGSVPTPYIFDERVDFRKVAEGLYSLWEEKMNNPNSLKIKGLKGREWALSDEASFTSEKMCKNIIKGINNTFDSFKPRPKYTLTKVKQLPKNKIKHPITY